MSSHYYIIILRIPIKVTEIHKIKLTIKFSKKVILSIMI